MKIKLFLLLSFFITLGSTGISEMVYGDQISSVETDGSVVFKGTYIPVGSPDPSPTESIEKPAVSEIAKPGGKLPQTNDASNNSFVGIGLLLIIIVICIIIQRKKQFFKHNYIRR
ncbi:LPXTG cell wall anchor domain-containing protein [Enterococcus casseliflavus]|uniref:LPXTG cell wall anchor domain-containing protein n=1 Tax=Enterococcus casseliflavus TaxID=37734 RepID=UPI00232CB445|nr:LPXTG cell wall anchor domain-containing protein [Enterococcus casseliflavus]MDB1689571.1 LPXTG cell wall anchor domain-containing protein [Enterococcus casseliflavus]